jgi:hypothetical protein
VYWGTIMVPKLDIYVDTSNPSYTLWCTDQQQPTNQPSFKTHTSAYYQPHTKAQTILLNQEGGYYNRCYFLL